MHGDREKRSLTGSLQALQDSVQRAGPAATASYALIGSIIFLGGLGYAIDWWRGTAPVWLIIGLLLGFAFGMYQLARTVWRR